MEDTRAYPYYDSISESMELYLDGEVDSYFQITVDPVINLDGIQETKTVTAMSIECELQNKFLKNFKINCGVKESLEYLVDDNVDNAAFSSKFFFASFGV